MPADLCLVNPGEDGVVGQLRAAVTDDHLRHASLPNDRVQFTGDMAAADRGDVTDVTPFSHPAIARVRG